MSEKDGGPAFPCRIPSMAAAVGPTIGDEWEQSAARRCPPKVQSDPPMMWSSGMSLRDYFAIHGPEPTKEAIEVVASREKAANQHGDSYEPPRRGWNEIRIALRWEFADAMLKERAKV